MRRIQQALRKKGFNVGEPDGSWGPRTEAALRDFQRSAQLPANAQIDAQTLAALGLDPGAVTNLRAQRR